jgi:hypothetical protein
MATFLEFSFVERRRAAHPATKGVAMDVPERTAKEPRFVGMVDKIFPPGAPMAGLKKKSLVGP